MSQIFKEGVDLYIPMGTYDDPKRFINREACKALGPSPYCCEALPMGLCTLKYFGDIPAVRNIVLNGPKDRIEEAIEKNRHLLPDKKIIVKSESRPGNLSVALDDMLKNFLDCSLGLSEYVLICSSDYARLNSEITNIIFNDFQKAVYSDIAEGVNTELYIAVGNLVDDNKDYSRVRDFHIERNGFILGSSKAWRFGNTFLVRPELARYKKENAEALIIHADWRKINENFFGAVLYWSKQLFAKGKERPLKKASAFTKAILNYAKKHVFSDIAPYPYFTISNNDCNALVSDALGISIKFVETLGSADIDNNKEFESVKMNSKR